MDKFSMITDFIPSGDQPQAIRELTQGLNAGKDHQVLLGVTGSGKTFTIANVIERVQRPALIIAHNTKRWLRNCMKNSKACFLITLWNILSAIMTITSRKPICQLPIPILKKTRQSMRK